VEVIENLPIQLHGAAKAEVLAAARVKSVFPISLADAFAAALAKSNQAKIRTGDREFKALEKTQELAIEWLPQNLKKRRNDHSAGEKVSEMLKLFHVATDPWGTCVFCASSGRLNR
jgi:hypothetical protein